MSTINNKYILGGIFVVIIAFSAYFIFSKKSSPDSGGGTPGKSCPYGRDKNGNCITPPDICGDDLKPPPNQCDSDQQLICDQKTKKWRCKSTCETSDNPFPYDFSFCETENVKCDTNGKYYCKSDYCQNGGILYSNTNGICSCPSGFIGDKCQYDTTKCKGGQFDINTGKCTSCCDNSTSYTYGDSKICKYSGDKCDQKCDDNYAYDPKSGRCVCPDCFLKKNENECSQLSDCCKNGSIQDEKCICKDGWTGVNCDIPICGDYGDWNNTTKKCDCGKDKNGNNIAVGDRCQYTREMCNNNGNPVIFNGVPSCVCNSNFSGSHCKCDNSQKPNEDTCRGISSYCTEKGWDMKFLECNDIYNQPEYGSKDNWERECTAYLSGDPQIKYPDYKIKCRRRNIPDKDGLNDFIVGEATCNAKPTSEMLNECRGDPKCFISWENPTSKLSNSFNKVCNCHSTVNGPSYYCDSVSSNNNCGPLPPKGFCLDGDNKSVDPDCVSCGQDNYSFVCKGSPLPKDCLTTRWNLSSNPIPNSNKLWYKTGNSETVFPTINMDNCSDPFNSLNGPPYNALNDPTYGLGYNNIGSESGFVTGIDAQTPTFYGKDNKDIIVYNINAKINDKTISLIDNNPYPFPNSYKDLIFENNTGCAKKRNFDSDQEENTRCFIAEDGESTGDFKQYCADKSYNITDCSSKEAFYKTDKGYCKCTKKYKSNAQSNNDFLYYKGKYCQYNDNITCNGNGIVDDDGKCLCLHSYAGSNCQYSDSKTCNGTGIVQNDGSCICDIYTSQYDGLTKKFMGNTCQYDDTTHCKNQGSVKDNNGNCKWDSTKVFPRCTEFVNPDETDYNNLQCKKTVLPSLFSTNCIQTGLNITPKEYGCPKIRDPIPWTDYTGVSCHYPNKDSSNCTGNSYVKRVCKDNNCSEDNSYNACRSDDFSGLPNLNNISTEGITNKTVTGLGGVRVETGTFVQDDIYYGYHPNPLMNPDPKKWNDICNFGFSGDDRYRGGQDIGYDFFD